MTLSGVCFVAVLSLSILANAAMTGFDERIYVETEALNKIVSLRDSLAVVRAAACAAAVVLFFLRDPFATRTIQLAFDE